jgi:quercetin dioxygenase-like cupin family protein
MVAFCFSRISTQEADTMQCYNWNDVETDNSSKSFFQKHVTGDRMMIARTETEKGSLIPSRRNPRETFIAIIEGAWRVSLPGRELTLKSDQVLHLPPNVEHSIESLDRTVALEVFAEQEPITSGRSCTPFLIEDENYLWGV